MPSTTLNLSPRMRDLIVAVETLTERRGFPPSLVELARELRVHPSRAQQLAVQAEARGALVREARLARSLRVPSTDNSRSQTTAITRRKTK